MKLCSSSFLRVLGNHQKFRVLVSLFSTGTRSAFSASPLLDRIQVIRDPRVSLVPELDQWVEEEKSVSKEELQSLIQITKDFKRFNHALEHAENYFNSISKNLKTYSAYGALLNAYARYKSVEKAEAIMQKMREMGLATSSFPYNMLINLYSQVGENEKIDVLMQEMKMKGIPQDMFTYRNLLSAYVATSNISGVENILNLLEEDTHYTADWKVYSVAADGYLKTGLIEKALTMLEKMEKKIPFTNHKFAFQHLLTFYARAGLKHEIYRVWNKYKPSNENMDASYACMITALAKVDDIVGAEKIFMEWESQCTTYDFRVLNRILAAYCKKGLIDKAELVVKKAIEQGTPYASTWNILGIGYMEINQMSKAVEMMKKTMLIGRQGWRLSSVNLVACLEYLEGERDVEGMEEIITLYRTSGPLTMDIYHRLLRAYVEAGKSVSTVLDQMKMDGFIVDEETQKILETRRVICQPKH